MKKNRPNKFGGYVKQTQKMMKLHSINSPLFTFLCLIILFAPACKKDCKKVDGSFRWQATNGQMAPDEITLTAMESSADTYDWQVDNNSLTGNAQTTVAFNIAKTYQVDLTVTDGNNMCGDMTTIEIGDVPVDVQALTIITGDGTVGTQVLNPDGTNGPWNMVGETGASSNSDVEIDDENGKVYYTGSIRRSNLNGTEQEVLNEDSGIAGIELDLVNNQIFFVQNFFETTFSISDLDGSNVKEIHFSCCGFVDMTFDATNRVLYWTDTETSFNKIRSVNVDGDPFESVSGYGRDITGAFAPFYALDFDNTNGLLYFASRDLEGVDILKVDPTNFENIAEVVVENASKDDILGLVVDPVNNFVYWSDQSDSTIKRVNLSTGVTETVLEDVTNPRALAIGNF